MPQDSLEGPGSEPGAGREPVPAADDVVPLLGMDVHALTRPEAARRVMALARLPRPALVVTPNVDHVVLLRHSEQFRRAYEAATLRLCDGAPLVALARLCGRPLPGRVTGADLMEDVCRLAAEQELRVFVAGGAPDVLDRGMHLLRGRYPQLRISGHSPPMAFEGTPADEELREVLRRAEPDVVMVCFGAPRAEIWAAQHMSAHPAAYLCVGAAIDFAAEARRRAPRWMQRVGAEWLYRLVQEPGRLWRRYLVRDAAFLPLALAELLKSLVRRRARKAL